MISICPRGVEERRADGHSPWTIALRPRVGDCVCFLGALADSSAVNDEFVRTVCGIVIRCDSAEHPPYQVEVGGRK